MPERFESRVVVVTGAASGIGLACAHRFASEGADVVLVDIDTVRGPAAADEVGRSGGSAVFVEADVADEDAWLRIREIAHERFGPVHVLHANAFASVPGEPSGLRLADLRKVLDVNVGGMFLGAGALIDDLTETGGSIVATSSVHALFGLPDHATYAASKGAICALTRQLAVQYAPEVRVNCVLPGPVDTPSLGGNAEEQAGAAAATVLGRLARPDEVAAAVAFLASSDASFITGASLMVDGGWSNSKDSIWLAVVGWARRTGGRDHPRC